MPNKKKAHRYTKDARNGYKTACFYAAKEARAEATDDAHIALTFCPPDNRRRDLDNLLAASKAGIDGIALACGVDDYGWSFSITRGDVVKGGAVLVNISEPAAVLIEMRGPLS